MTTAFAARPYIVRQGYCSQSHSVQLSPTVMLILTGLKVKWKRMWEIEQIHWILRLIVLSVSVWLSANGTIWVHLHVEIWAQVLTQNLIGTNSHARSILFRNFCTNKWDSLSATEIMPMSANFTFIWTYSYNSKYFAFLEFNFIHDAYIFGLQS